MPGLMLSRYFLSSFFFCKYKIYVLNNANVVLIQGAKITKASHFDYEYVLGHKVQMIYM